MALVKKLHSFFTSIPGIKQIKKKKEKENPFWLKNGGILLEELIATCNGVYNPFRIFSIEELITATNNFQSSFRSADVEWYNGTLDGRTILVRKYSSMEEEGFVDKGAYRDVATSIKMSDHNNVLKLLGCCLELLDPILVFEDAEMGFLNRWGGLGTEGSSLPWKMRLKIAKDIAYAVTFLHNAFSRPIVHRNINPSKVLLDKDYVAKLCDFSLSIPIPEGETRVEADKVMGTLGYLDPVYYRTSSVSDRSDVYSFGVFLLVLFTGKEAIVYSETEGREHLPNIARRETEVFEIVDPKILQELDEGGVQVLQLKAFLELALKCIKNNEEDRLPMIDVAKELRMIYTLQDCSYC